MYLKFIFYIKNGNFSNFLKTKSDQIYTKTHQLNHLKKNYRRGWPPNPLAKRLASSCTVCRFATCKFPGFRDPHLAAMCFITLVQCTLQPPHEIDGAPF